jgi:hypothetical protein
MPEVSQDGKVTGGNHLSPTYAISFGEKIEQTNASTTINFTSNVILIIKSSKHIYSKFLYKISNNKIIDSKPTIKNVQSLIQTTKQSKKKN